MAQEKPTLMYFGDPMCSWCYGFSPEFSKTMEKMKEALDYQIVMGGLRPYNTERIIDMKDFLREHWQHVFDKSGQEFSYEILMDPTFIYDTEPSCRAVVTMRKLKPESTFEYFKAVQSAFYFENKNTNLTQTFVEIAEKFGIEKSLFKNEFESDELKQMVREDFIFSNETGIRGFPTVVLKKGEQLFLIANGYAKSEVLVKKIKDLL